MEAQATVRFSTGSVELFGMQNFGGTFTVPGIVTIGPNFRVLGVCVPSLGSSFLDMWEMLILSSN